MKKYFIVVFDENHKPEKVFVVPFTKEENDNDVLELLSNYKFGGNAYEILSNITGLDAELLTEIAANALANKGEAGIEDFLRKYCNANVYLSK